MGQGTFARLALVAVPLAAGAAPAMAQDVYRAGASEPYWRVAIDARTIRFEEPGQPPIVMPRPVAKTSGSGDRFETKALILDTTRASCSMGDSDRVFRDMVIVEVGGRTLRGCGNGATGAQINAMKIPAARPPVAVAAAKPVPPRPVTPAAPTARPSATVAAPTNPPAAVKPTPAPVAPPPPPPPPGTPLELGKTRPVLANTRWTVWKMREQEVKTARPLTVSFSGNQVEGQLCNRFRGNYSLTGERLQAPSIMSTKMACAGPETAVETMLFGMLRQATRATISKWGTLTLGNGRDTIMLRPVK